MKKDLNNLILNDVKEKAIHVLNTHKVAIFIVAYNAASHIENVLNRIPDWISKNVVEIYIIDDYSVDNTCEAARAAKWSEDFSPIKIYRTPYNLGYGGNQCLGYQYAEKNSFDIVVLLHGDGQYAPEFLPTILAEYLNPDVDAVYGSRFNKDYNAKNGGMPLYKYYGNKVLSCVQNFLLKTSMEEMHSGYRSYRVKSLSKVPYRYNSKWFDFDADIIIQFKIANMRIKEVPIPTYYGDEVCHVDGVKYAWKCLLAALQYKCMQVEIFYHPKFDIESSDVNYVPKSSVTSIHHFVKTLNLQKGSRLLDVGCGHSGVGHEHSKRGVHTTIIDMDESIDKSDIKFHKVDLDLTWKDQFKEERFDTVFALDVLEHLKEPNRGLLEIHQSLKQNGRLYISTGNVAFFPIRVMMAFGFFNYGRRGILDLTHRRLYTISSFKRELINAGFQIDKVKPFGVPLTDLAGSNVLTRSIENISNFFASIFSGLFAYQILLCCTRIDTEEDLMHSLLKNNHSTPK